MPVKETGEALAQILRLETRPVGIKLYPKRGDLSKGPLNFNLNICQLVSMARHQGRANGAAPDGMVCAMGAACVGLIATPEVFVSGRAAVGPYTKDERAGRAFMANTFKIGDKGKKYAAILVAPLTEMAEEPDVVAVYGNPAQMMRFIHACTYDNGQKVSADTVAEAALCSCIGFAVANDKPVIGFPCAGDRIFGGTQNHELVFAAPYRLVRDELVNNLEATARGGFSVYPVPPNMHWTPAMPPTYTMQREYLET